MKNSDIQRIEHMKVYCEDVIDAIKTYGNDFAIFQSNVHYRNSVAMSIQQIGEFVGGLSIDFRGAHPMLWEPMKGMRNIIAHAYHTANRKTIWATAINDIPPLLKFCEDILAQEETKDKE